MGRDLRGLLYELLQYWEVLKLLIHKAQSHLKLSDSERVKANDLVRFLERIKDHTISFVQGTSATEVVDDEIQLDFLAALTLVGDERLSHGTVYAIQSVPLAPNSKSLDEDGEFRAIDRLNQWIVLLQEFDNENGSLDLSDLNEMLVRFEHTLDRIENSMRN